MTATVTRRVHSIHTDETTRVLSVAHCRRFQIETSSVNKVLRTAAGMLTRIKNHSNHLGASLLPIQEVTNKLKGLLNSIVSSSMLMMILIS